MEATVIDGTATRVFKGMPFAVAGKQEQHMYLMVRLNMEMGCTRPHSLDIFLRINLSSLV